MRDKKTKFRNREIFAKFEAGQTLENLGEQYGLSVARVRAVVTEEKYRHEVSPEYFYEALRSGWLLH